MVGCPVAGSTVLTVWGAEMALSFLDLTLLTIRDLRGNLLRSGLTTLGIFMGVAAVNATLNISAITNAQIQQKLAQRDHPFVIPFIHDRADVYADSPQIDAALAQTLQRSIPGIRAISTTSQIYSSEGVTFEGESAGEVQVLSVSQNYQQTTGRKMVQGRFFEPADFAQYRPVAIIDQGLANQLFQGKSPLGAGVYVAGTRFTVVGVTETKSTGGEEWFKGQLWLTQSYGKVLGAWSWGRTQIALRTLADYQSVQEQIRKHLLQRFPQTTIFMDSNAEDLYKEEQQQRTSAMVLKVVGVLALVIGGVGIANITVAAVIERTREIGVRRAIGATDLEVMGQFIMEATVLSVVGGVSAIAAVHFLTQVATTTVFEAPYEFRWRDAAISMVAAFAVGVGSSFVPALRITQIDVVQALRGE